MVEFGEEGLLVESLIRIPWLIWIQLLVFFLLIVFLYCFSSSDSDNPSCSLTSSQKQPVPLHLHHHVLEGENRATNINSRGRRSAAKNAEGNCSGTSGLLEDRHRAADDKSLTSHNPCNIVRLAKIAFLKCLGLYSSTSSVDNKIDSEAHQ